MKWTKSTNLWKGSPEFGVKTILDQTSLAQKQNWKVLSHARSKVWPCSFNDEFFLGRAIGLVLKTQIPDEVVRLLCQKWGAIPMPLLDLYQDFLPWNSSHHGGWPKIFWKITPNLK